MIFQFRDQIPLEKIEQYKKKNMHFLQVVSGHKKLKKACFLMIFRIFRQDTAW